jgi:hypothetical protein
MHFDEAFDILVEYCTGVGPDLAAAVTGPRAMSARVNTYGNDIWIPEIVRNYRASRRVQGDLTEAYYLPFYDAAWELCRIGVLRPGPHASMGQGMGGGTYSGDGYSITEFGHQWLANPDRHAAAADPSRMSEILVSFAQMYGPGFAQRAVEAVRCHRTQNYLAACVMSGAAAESILLAVASEKTKDEQKVLKQYAGAGGRGLTAKLVMSGLRGSIVRQFEAALQVLHYWRDDAAHGMSTTISEVEAYASLTQLLRLAQFCSDRWVDLTTP